MANPTISSETTEIGFWRLGGDVAYLRVFALQSFRTADGQFVPIGDLSDYTSCCLELELTVNGDLSLSVPSTALLPFTTTSNRVNAKYAAWLYDENNTKQMPWITKNFGLAASLGASTTWTLIQAYADASQLARPARVYWDADQVEDAINAAVVGANAPKATPSIFGISELFEAAADSANPKVVGPNSIFINSARTITAALAAASSVVQGTIGKLTDGFKGMVYRSSVLVSRFNLGAYSLTDFGGVDDGSTDNTTAIQAWLDAIATGEGRGKLVKSANGSGQFNFSGTLNWPATAKMTLEGDGSAQGSDTKLYYTGSSVAIKSEGAAVYYSVIKNLTLETAPSSTGTTGILLTGSGGANTTQFFTFDNVMINGFETGIHVLATDVSFAWQCSYIKTNRLSIFDCFYAIRINSLNSDWNMTDLITSARTDGYAIYADRCAALLLDHPQLLGGEGVGSACSGGIPNPDYGETAIHLEGARGNIQINNGQQEGFRNSMEVNEADIEHPIDFINCVLTAPTNLNEDTIFNSFGSQFYDNSVFATTANTRITSIGDGISTLDTCLDPGTGIGGFTVSGGARLRKLDVYGLSLDEASPLSLGTKPNASDPTLAVTPQMSLASSITDKVLLAIGQAAASVLSNHFQVGRDSAGFLGFNGTQAIPNRGMKFNGPMKFVGTSAVSLGAATRSVADAVVTNASASITSATASFTAADIGKIVLLSGGSTVPNGTWIAYVTSSTAATLSAVVTTTGVGRTLAIYGNAIINYDPAANLTQLSENGAAFANLIKASTTQTAATYQRASSNSVIENGLLKDNGTNLQVISGLLQFLGITSSFPALKRSGTTLQHRLADDSADGPMSASNGTFSGTLGVTGATTLGATTTTTLGATTMTATSLAATGLIKSSSPTTGIGYAAGAGGVVTQLTSRTTGVTLNTVSGAITLFSAAGSATPFSLTVTNSAVAATDVIIVCQKSGTDIYTTQVVTAVAAGSFRLTLANASGTTVEQPVFNFVVIKGVAS